MRTLIAETPTFTRRADALFCQDEKLELIDLLSEDPLAGEEVPGTNGIRKLSFAATGEGRRGGEQEIYYNRDEDMQTYLLLASAQSANSDLTPAESLAVSELAIASGRRFGRRCRAGVQADVGARTFVPGIETSCDAIAGGQPRLTNRWNASSARDVSVP